MEDGNSAAERLYDAANAQDERERALYMAKALDDVVERVMNGERVPKSGYPAIDLVDFLENNAQAHQLLARILTNSGDAQLIAIYEAGNDVEHLLRRHLDGSQFVADRASEMAEDAREERML